MKTQFGFLVLLVVLAPLANTQAAQVAREQSAKAVVVDLGSEDWDSDTEVLFSVSERIRITSTKSRAFYVGPLPTESTATLKHKRDGGGTRIFLMSAGWVYVPGQHETFDTGSVRGGVSSTITTANSSGFTLIVRPEGINKRIDEVLVRTKGARLPIELEIKLESTWVTFGQTIAQSTLFRFEVDTISGNVKAIEIIRFDALDEKDQRRFAQIQGIVGLLGKE